MSEKVVFKGAREDLASKHDKQQELATILCERHFKLEGPEMGSQLV